MGTVTAFAVVIVLALIYDGLGVTEIGPAIIWAVLFGVAFMFGLQYNGDRISGKSFGFSLSNSVVAMIAFAVVGIILTVWP